VRSPALGHRGAAACFVRSPVTGSDSVCGALDVAEQGRSREEVLDGSHKDEEDTIVD
jgi:hypothetical protein